MANNNNPIGFDDLFRLDDTTAIDKAIKVIDALSNTYSGMVSSVTKDNNELKTSIQQSLKEFESLKKSLSKSTGNTESIAKDAKAVDDLSRSFQSLQKQQADYEKTISKLQKEIDKLQAGKAKLKKVTDLEAGSVAELKKRLQDAEKQFISYGKASGEAAKAGALEKVADLNKEYQEQKKILDQAKKSKLESAEANNKEANAVQNLKKQIKEAEAEYLRLSVAVEKSSETELLKKEQLDRIRELAPAVKDAEKAIRDSKRGVEVAAGSYYEMQERVSRLKVELKSLPEGMQEGSAEVQRLQREIREASDQLTKFDKIVGDNFRNVGNYSSALEGLSGAFQNVNPSGLFGGGGNDPGIGGIASGIGGLAAGVPQLALAAGIVTGIGEAFSAVEQQVKEVNKQLSDTESITGQTGKSLDKLTAGIRASAKVFDREYNEVLQSANVLMRTFGIEGEEALNIINTGLAQGLDLNGEFLDSIKEYSVQFDAAGLSANDLYAILQQSAEQGIYSDKAVDTVKEAGLRLREMTVATNDALKPLGKLINEQVRAEIGAGDTFKAMQTVARGLETVNLTAAETQTIIADVFGAAGEDAGLKFIKSLGDIETGVTDVSDSLNKYQKLQLDIVDSQARAEEQTIRLAHSFDGLGQETTVFFNNLKADSYEALNNLITYFQDADIALERFKKGIRDNSTITSLTKELELLQAELQGIQENSGSWWQALIPGGALVAKGETERMKLLREQIFQVQLAIRDMNNGQLEAADTIELATYNYSLQADAVNKVREAEFELQKLRLQGQTGWFEDQASDEEGDIIKRISLYRDAAEAKAEIAELEKQQALEAVNDQYAAEEAALKETLESQLKIYEANRAKINDAYAKDPDLRTKKLTEEAVKFQNIEKDLQSKIQNIEKQSYTERQIAFEKFSQEIYTISRELDERIDIDFAITGLDLGVDSVKEAGDEIIKKIGEIEKIEIKNPKGDGFFGPEWKEGLKLSIESAKGLMNELFEFEQSQNQRRIAALEEQKAYELALAGENADSKKAIEERYNERLKKLREEQAKDEKKQKEFNILTSTIQGVAMAASRVELFPFNFVLAGLIATQGAVQLANLKNAPVPKFAKGTNNAPEGWAIVDEEGKEGLVRDGKTYIGQDKGPRLTYLEKGDKIIPNHKLSEVFLQAPEKTLPEMVSRGYESSAKHLQELTPKKLTANDFQQMIDLNLKPVVSGLNQVQKAIITKPTSHINLDENGLQKWIQNGQNRTYYKNKRKI